MSKRPSLVSLFLLIALVGLSVYSVSLMSPPEALPANAPGTDFSAERAMVHVREVASQPHAMGTPGHAEARQYLFNQMEALGLQPEVQEAVIVNPVGETSNVGYVYNLLGRLKGTQPGGKAVLVMAHYDSQPNTPGAGDDGAGIAAMLETARALQTGKPLQHDVIFLMTDGEEYGLYGAKAFLKHPWAKEVGVVVNVEARGNAGPSMTFEISPENGWIVEQFAAAAPYPFASSMMYEVYRNLPNNTDFTVFRDAGYTGINSAIIDGFVHYHKMTDSPENLDRNSLQHHGSNMLALVRHLGNVPLDNTKAQDKIFFNPAGSWLVQYPASWNLLWAALSTVLLLACVIVGIRRKAFSGQQLLGGFLGFLLVISLVAGLSFPITSFVKSMLPYSHDINGVYGDLHFFMSYLLLSLGLMLLLSWLLLRWMSVFALCMGVCLIWFSLMVAALLLVPAAAYLFMFPLLFCLLALLVLFLRDLHQQPVGWGYALVLLVGIVPAIFMLMPLVRFLFVVFALQMPVAMVATLLLLAGLAIPMLMVVERSFGWRTLPLLPVFLLFVGGIQLFRAIQAEKPTDTQPLHSHVSYYLNTDDSVAVWASAFKRTDDWNRQFFPKPTTGALTEIYPMAAREYLKNEAAPIPVQAPVASLVNEAIAPGERVLTIRLQSPRGAAHLDLVLQPSEEDGMLGAAINGEALALGPMETAQGAVYYAKVHGLPDSKEVELEVRLKQSSSLQLYLYDVSIGLPQELVREPMPAHVIPEQGRESNLTLVRKSYRF
ncbi:M20/M25/M40 family metallo-hydrolase [Pontibacter sp. BT731]|uniref:M20/M25/M40 family metallo-hydrolase n=1 Tax=Pontibacter coccineus TaxID=3063328 RepID=UPI0026E2FD61|nr:M20/M25/M40 family metallo-hydrolase [Pontibacter sp. BT731]MDO6389247.1 M20/M25/M40 family metallo-hydrolase [Pontibacter sp. BT731]